MNICIIGGSGFVGTELIFSLSNYNLTNIDKSQSTTFPTITLVRDIRNKKNINIPKETNIVVLLAAEHKDDVSPSSLYYDVNVNGTANVLEKMDEIGIKQIIFTSSVAVYGLNKINPNESHEIDPFNHYGKSKWLAEKEIRNWFENDPNNKSATIIRPTVIFGEKNRGNVYNLLKQISSGNFIMIGNGSNKKSMAYIGNVVAFIKHQIENNKFGYNIYNYSDMPDKSMSELVSFINKYMSLSFSKIRIPYFIGIIIGYFFDIINFFLTKNLPISSVRIKKFCATTQFDSLKVHKLFKPKYTLDEGLKRMLKHEFLNKK